MVLTSKKILMKNIILKQSASVILFTLISSNIFCQIDTITSNKNIPEKAKIIFTRQSSMLGAAFPHYVIDKGDTNNLNAYILEKKILPAEESNFGKMANVKRFYMINKSKQNILLAGHASKGDITIDNDIEMYHNPMISIEIYNYLKYFDYYLNRQPITANVCLTGIVWTGKTIIWERLPGTAQLEVITEGGDQIVAPAFKVEAGKTYYIIFNYAKSYFDISEKN